MGPAAGCEPLKLMFKQLPVFPDFVNTSGDRDTGLVGNSQVSGAEGSIIPHGAFLRGLKKYKVFEVGSLHGGMGRITQAMVSLVPATVKPAFSGSDRAHLWRDCADRHV